jgi:hypothetical protein
VLDAVRSATPRSVADRSPTKNARRRMDRRGRRDERTTRGPHEPRGAGQLPLRRGRRPRRPRGGLVGAQCRPTRPLLRRPRAAQPARPTALPRPRPYAGPSVARVRPRRRSPRALRGAPPRRAGPRVRSRCAGTRERTDRTAASRCAGRPQAHCPPRVLVVASRVAARSAHAAPRGTWARAQPGAPGRVPSAPSRRRSST